jgi:heat shock protein 4
VFRIDEAQLIEEITVVEKPVEVTEAPPPLVGDAMETDAAPAAEGAAPGAFPAADAPAPVPSPQPNGDAPKPEPKKKFKKTELSVTAHTPSLPKHLLLTHRELETSMIQSDKLIVDTEYAKNALEEYVYDVRGKLEDRWAEFVKEGDKEVLMKGLNENEEWLYSEEGEEAGKSMYKERLDALKVGLLEVFW